MNKIEGMHHLAIGTADIKGQIAYFTDVLGMELVALYWMHGVENTFHGFLRLNDESSLAFVQSPDFAEIPTTLGQTHAGSPGGLCAPGTMQHLALKVKDDDELMAMQDRIRSRGVPVLGPIDHGFCKSIYFAGLENLTLELSYSNEAINGDAWIDPEVMELAGITAAEVAVYRKPARHEAEGQPRPQPDSSGPGPHMQGYSADAYQRLMAMPDEKVQQRMSVTEPPVRVD
ncbi:MAG: VOC family protein [Rhodospirillaceae bacterium]|jgi:catechol 2,3-dioxygenase-like lactoylglutathione lyase family enzyme|nr:VOC family protein [Rhodospirillaceae bacterium]MBT5193816.1 VOC family protein [Rhodospirillaceae bacterium]MBT5897277.1 VOC family protein [Rhodospirillaceae bacterium]MBT6430899.1 VOC family protein [Rhodospirillaceae bacterium]MBT7760589.1 VOC family protein [Rhodospirillaceae bacterium]